jgi:hypothetical protein
MAVVGDRVNDDRRLRQPLAFSDLDISLHFLLLAGGAITCSVPTWKKAGFLE